MKNLPFPVSKATFKLGRLKAKASTPINQHLVDQEKIYTRKLPRELEALVPQVENFILNEVSRPLLALDIGFDNARDILERVLDSKVDLLGNRKFLEHVIQDAINLKALNHVVNLTNLNTEDARALKTLYFVKASGMTNADEKFLSKVLSIFNLPGQAERPQALVQQLPVNERPSARRRVGGLAPSSRWEERRVGKPPPKRG